MAVRLGETERNPKALVRVTRGRDRNGSAEVASADTRIGRCL